jgi:AraC-like DNA-binding protein
MICQDFLPHPTLRWFVRCYHLRHFKFSKTGPSPIKPYAPRPEQTLAFFPHGNEAIQFVGSGEVVSRPRSALLGQYTQRTNRLLIGEEFCALLIDFQPGMLHRLTGLPYDELTDSFVDAEAALPKEIQAVNGRLRSADSPAEMIGIVEQYLFMLSAQIQKQSHRIDRLGGILMNQTDARSVISLAEQSCFSPRQFERLFKERMGVSPKQFLKISRLTKAFALKYNRPDMDWLSVALVCGYHDYQHMAKDFKDLAGVSPVAYMSEDGLSPERQFGLLDSSLTSMSRFYH